mgnify:CR=1 FL=1
MTYTVSLLFSLMKSIFYKVYALFYNLLLLLSLLGNIEDGDPFNDLFLLKDSFNTEIGNGFYIGPIIVITFRFSL